MKDRSNIEFDQMMRSMLADAEEQAPEQVWAAVSSRLAARRRSAAIWRWSGACAAVAAAAAIVLTLATPVHRAASGLAAPELTAELAMPVQSQPATASEAELEPQAEETAQVARKSPAPRNAAVAESRQEQTAMTEEARPAAETADPAVQNTQETVSTEEAGSAQECSLPAKEKWVDPFALMAYEDSRKARNSRTVAFDVKGLVGTNDNVKAGGMGNVIMGAPVKETASENVATIAEDGESVYGVPMSFGLGVKVGLGGRWSIGTGVSYSLLSRSFPGIYTPAGGPAESVKKITHRMQYVGVPVNVFFDVLSNDAVSLYTFAGGTAEKAISNKYIIPGAAANETLSQSVKGMQWSTALGLGVQFRLTEHLGIYLDPAARYYFNCSQPKSIRSQQPLMFSLEAGLRFKL